MINFNKEFILKQLVTFCKKKKSAWEYGGNTKKQKEKG